MNIHTRALFMYKLQIHQLLSPLFCLNVQKFFLPSLSHSSFATWQDFAVKCRQRRSMENTHKAKLHFIHLKNKTKQYKNQRNIAKE